MVFGGGTFARRAEDSVPLQYISFYELDPDIMPTCMNLAHDWDLGLLTTAGESGLRMLPDVSSVFFYSAFRIVKGARDWGALRLRSDFATCWKAFFSLVRPLIDKGRLEGVFLGDELLWQGAHPRDIKTACDTISNSFATVTGGATLIIYLNEAQGVFNGGTNIFGAPVKPDASGNPTEVTVAELGVTHISVDDYNTFDAPFYYKAYLYPRMTPSQRAFVVPQAYSSVYDPWEGGRLAVTAGKAYVEWANEDPRVVGVNPWHWFSYNFDCTPLDEEKNPIHNSIGVLDNADLRAFWLSTSQQIVSSSTHKRLTQASLPLRHSFTEFADGAALPSIYSTDHDGRGGTGLSDPLPPPVSDVCFSTSPDGRRSILMRKQISAFRYTWGTVPRALGGIQWVSPRASGQIFTFEVWINSLSGLALSISLQYGGSVVAQIDIAHAAASKLVVGAWNEIATNVNLNSKNYSVALNGAPLVSGAITTENSVTEVLITGGLCFLSNFELRSDTTRYARLHQNTCDPLPSVSAFDVSRTRIGAVNASGEAYVKDRAYPYEKGYWTWESSDIQAIAQGGAFSAVGQRIGVLKKDGNVYAKEGLLDAAWTWESSDVAAIALSEMRIGVLKKDGNVYVKEGNLDAGWTWESSDVAALSLNGVRIGVVKTDGSVYVKEGNLDAPWTLESGDCAALALSGPRIGVLKRDGNVYVKKDGLSGQWTWESSDVAALSLSGSRIGVLKQDGNVYVKEGDLDAAWTWETGSAIGLALYGDDIVVLTSNGALLVKSGGLDAGWLQLTGSSL